MKTKSICDDRAGQLTFLHLRLIDGEVAGGKKEKKHTNSTVVSEKQRKGFRVGSKIRAGEFSTGQKCFFFSCSIAAFMTVMTALKPLYNDRVFTYKNNNNS